jgi:threonine dehydrogenase-like Zn-dependent dehydrogenase
VFAAVTRSPGDIVVDDIPEPGPSRPGRVVVRPETVGICGSDLHLFSGHTGALSDARDFFPGIPQAPPHLELRLVAVHLDGGVQERLDVKPNAAFPAGDLDAGCAAFAEPMSIAVHAPRRAGPSAWGGGREMGRHWSWARARSGWPPCSPRSDYGQRRRG